MNKLF